MKQIIFNIIVLLIWFIAPAQKNNITESKPTTLAKRFMLFDELSNQSIYSITIAADVPDNRRPMKVYYKKEPGHVFIILEKKDTVTDNTVSQSWGFYPVRPISSLFVRTVKCELRNNGSREYEAAIKKFISKEEFELIRSKAIALSAKKYNLNRYNCYNYALDLYNALPGVAAIPVEKIRFPFVFGKGGSPCILYKYLTNLNTSSSVKNSFSIYIGSYKAPANGLVTNAVYAGAKNNSLTK